MRKLTAFIMSMLLMLTATACTTGNTEAGGNAPSNEIPVQPTTSEPTPSNTSVSVSSPESDTGGGPASQENDGTLVIYFSATGNTKSVAETIAKTTGGDLYEIVPEEPYTADDLNWNDDTSRVNTEHNDTDFRPAIAGKLPDLSGYRTIFIGYPIWWGEAPNIVRTLVEGLYFTDKTVIPFSTSSSSGFGSSGETLEALTSGATWLEGQRFRGGAEEAEITDWVSGLDI